jgi:peptide/nickel transport system substrate-binding protein
VSERDRRISAARKGRNEVENHIVDVYLAGRISRREFVRRASVAGMSVPMIGMLLAACGDSDDDGTTSSAASAPATSEAAAPSSSAAGPEETVETGGVATTPEATEGSEPSSSAAAGGAPGGTIRVGIQTPTTEVDPVLNGDVGGIGVLGLTGEFLAVNTTGELQPWLAESWEPNADASEWTFTIRQGVTFNDGTPMTAKDVAASIDRLADPANKSNALSVFKGVLSPGNTTAPDDATVVFKLDAPNGSFPYLVSSDNYNAIILPEAYAGEWTKTFIGTGPWKMDSYSEGANATLSRYEGYWGAKALPDTCEVTFAADIPALVLALQGGQLDVVQQVTVSDAQAILDDPAYQIIAIKASTHRQLSMRTDMKPFDDARVRRAVALTINRQEIVDGLFQGKASLGNDSPFAPVFAQTDTSVPQREQSIDEAKALLAEAGVDGFKTELVAIKTGEVPEYAQIVAESAKEIGVDISLKVLDGTAYYGDAVFGSSPWLDSVMSLCDYGHRGVPNVFLGAPLQSEGTWNAAHFKNPTYDGLVKEYVAAVDIDSQKASANKIQTLLLEETPIIFAYFYDYLIGAKAGLTNVRGTAIGHIWPDQVSVA